MLLRGFMGFLTAIVGVWCAIDGEWGGFLVCVALLWLLTIPSTRRV